MSKRNLVLVALLTGALAILNGCSSISMKMPANRFDSPEARGGFLKVNFDPVILEGSSQLTMVSDYTITPPPTSSPSFNTADFDYTLAGGVGLLDRLDFTVKIPPSSPTLYGVKYQFLGDTQVDSHVGNFSLAATLAGGYGSDGGQAPGIFGTTTSSYTLNEWAWDASIVAGYRVVEPLLLYAGPFYSQYSLGGTITQPAAGGTNYFFGGVGRQYGVSLGYELTYKIVELKFDVAWAQARFGGQSISAFYPGLLFGFRL